MASAERVALVSGGAKRVGRAIVEKLAASGFDVAFTYLTSEAEAAGLRKWIYRKRGRSGVAIKADLAQPQEAANHIYEEFTEKFDRLDVLVNSASWYARGKLAQTNVQTIRRLNAIHVESPLLLCQKFEKMLRSSRGHVINMCDLLAKRPWPEYLAYCASKAALVNLTLSLARELAPQVTVNGIAPGVVEWPAGYPASEKRKYLDRVPLGRAGTAEDVANLVLALATQMPYVTGQIIRLDGGRSIT